MMEKLKPCPFCDGEAMLVSVPCKRGISPYYWWVKCRRGCVSTHAYTSDHDAVEAWDNFTKGKRSEDADEEH